MKNKNFFGFIGLFFLVGCAYVPHETNLAIQAPVVLKKVGSGVNLSIKVIDDRDSEIIGKRGVGNSGGSITARNLMASLESAVLSGYQAKDFNVVERAESDVHLTVKLRAVKYMMSMGFWTGGEDISVVINAQAKNGNEEFDTVYRFNQEDRKVFIASGTGLDADINNAVNITVGRLLNDREMDAFLTQGSN